MKLAIVGTGISGLSAAWLPLGKRGVRAFGWDGRPERVGVRLVNDRDLPGERTSYDRIVTIETLEAVGFRHHPGVRRPGDGERFVRLRDLCLACCEGGPATRHVGSVQLFLTRSGNRALGPVPPCPGPA